jgi:hypothetical protein
MLNSFWGKFGQKENSAQTQIINQPADLFKLVMNPAVVVGNLTILNDERVLVSWERIEEDISPLKTVNVVVAAYTTAMARLELYKYLEQLGCCITIQAVLFLFRVKMIGAPDRWFPR